ncbi:MAG: hypothetical protein JXA79_06750 [Deltaproteobacteria bacterium]|nr:hypothetical protein [Deltaproteobacteria bacterium]
MYLLRLLNGAVSSFLVVPGLGQGHKRAKRQRSVCALPVRVRTQTGAWHGQAQRRKKAFQKLWVFVRLALKPSFLGIVVDFKSLIKGLPGLHTPC